MMQQIRKFVKAAPLVIIISMALLTAYLVFAFFKHVHVPLTTRQDMLSASDLVLYKPKTYSYTANMQRWVDANQLLTAPDYATNLPLEETPEQTQQRLTETPLLTNATDIGGMLVRLRAVFIQPDTQNYFAVFEFQDTDSRQTEYISLALNEIWHNYRITNISREESTLSKIDVDEPQQFIIPIFGNTDHQEIK